MRQCPGYALLPILAAGLAGAVAQGQVIEGTATIVGSARPAAGVTLRLVDRDRGGSDVATDAEGRFRFTPPPGVNIAVGKDGQQGPQCWVQAQDASRWAWAPVYLGPYEAYNDPRKEVGQAIVRFARTVWRTQGGVTQLEVECPSLGAVDVVVRGPDGRPLAECPVVVIPILIGGLSHGLQPLPTVRFTGKSDAAGRLQFGLFEGVARFRVIAPGLGLGSTGIVEVVGGGVARPEMPPLIRSGSISGRVDPKLLAPGLTIDLGTPDASGASAVVDESGRFTMADVPPGRYSTFLRNGRTYVFSPPTAIRVAPGQAVEGVEVRPADPPLPTPPDPQLKAMLNPRDEGGEVVWLAGTVRDSQGRPIDKAEIALSAQFNAGMRMGHETLTATTDARGHFEIRGPKRRGLFILSMIVRATDRPPTVVNVRRPPDGEAPSVDVTIGDRGGSARVGVVEGGRPLVGVTVGLRLRGSVPVFDRPPDRWVPGPSGETHETGVTGPDGVARFPVLYPGTYDVTASRPGAPSAWATGRLVAGFDGETALTVAIRPAPAVLRVRAVRPDGRPQVGEASLFHFNLDATDSRGHSPIDFDGRGVVEIPVEAPGLWRVKVRFQGRQGISPDQEPYDEASEIVPVSPGILPDAPTPLVTTRVGRGSLRVRLLGLDGKPARGSITLNTGSPLLVEHAATADAQGIARFADLPRQLFEVRGFVDGESAPPMIAKAGPFPEDAALRDRAEVVGTLARVEPGSEQAVEVRSGLVGYIRGRVRPEAGHELADYAMPFYYYGHDALQPRVRSDGLTGEFLAGPFRPGKVILPISRRAKEGWFVTTPAGRFDVTAGGIARVDLRPGEVDAGGLTWERHPLFADPGSIGGLVVQSDGTTPAFAARALLYLPGVTMPVASALGDGSGRLSWRGHWTSSDVDPKRRPAPVERPTVVIRGAADSGAVVVEVEAGKPMPRVVLPTPIVVRGTVTIGGRPIDGRPGVVRVVAAHEGRGIIDESLGVEATADPQGRFTLRGLTPGRHVIQAARDGIWLSGGVPRTIGTEPVDPLDLNIPEPGGPAVVSVVDAEGRPVASEPLTLVRPGGPLASLWPTTYRTGPDGTVTILGLEAGHHPVLLGPNPLRREIHARPIEDQTPSTTRIVLDRPNP